MAELLAVANHSPPEDVVDDEGYDEEEHAKDDHAATLTDATSRRQPRTRGTSGQAAAQAFEEEAGARVADKVWQFVGLETT